MALRMGCTVDQSGLSSNSTRSSRSLIPRIETYVETRRMGTIHREYAALLSLPYLDLVEDILYPRPPPIVEVDSREVESTMKAYEVNTPQAMAILGSLQHQGFSLIQGFVYLSFSIETS